MIGRQERLDRLEGLPQYMKDYPVYYAGPAKTPQGCVACAPETEERDAHDPLKLSACTCCEGLSHVLPIERLGCAGTWDCPCAT